MTKTDATPSNLDRFRKELDALIDKGERLQTAIQVEMAPDSVEKAFNQAGKNGKKILEALRSRPPFSDGYQSWYSEAKVLIKQLLPDRFADFVGHYESSKTRKAVSAENYRIADCLQGLTVTRGTEKIVGTDSAIPHVQQQLRILESIKARFESSLFDIRQLVMADLFDSELEAAEELAKKGFTRAAGAVAGVILEKHLAQVCENRSLKTSKKAPHISDLNDALKNAGIIELPQWRFIQHLADVRNLCDHSKQSEPTQEQVFDLIAGVSKVSKTLL